jgi:hypothetical protein
MSTLYDCLIDTIRKLLVHRFFFIFNLATNVFFAFYNLPASIASKNMSKFIVNINPIMQNLIKILFLIINYRI